MAGTRQTDDVKRPTQVSREEVNLRWEYYDGKLTREQFDKKLAKIRKLTKKP